ncbi:metal ABC transporter substrate-binding protein [Persephonella sp.]
MRAVFLVFLLFFTASFGQIKIYTTVKPVADIISAVSGTQVKYLIPPDASPHLYEPRAGQLKEAYQADLFVYIGSGEPKLTGLLQSIPEDKKIKVINIPGLKLYGEEPEEHEHHHVHPAVWLDPKNAVVIARFTADRLAEIDPANADIYRKNLEIFTQKAKTLEKKWKEKISQLKNKKFISYHYAWIYLTNAFGLEYAGVIEMGHGREPTVRHIMKIIKTIKKHRIKTIFSAVQFYNERYIQLIKRETGVSVELLDPFGINKNYIQMMEYNLKKVYTGLSQ